MLQHAKRLVGNQEKKFSERKRRIHNFLQEQRIGVLSTVTPDSKPHGVVVYYTVEDDLKLHILTKTGTHKYDNLIHNDHVMLTVFEPKTQTTVQVIGVAVERNGAENVKRVSSAIFNNSLHKSVGGLPPIVKLQTGAFTTFQIEPFIIRMATYARTEVGDYNELFESVESFEFRDED